MPEFGRDLEIVALVYANIEKRLVAAELVEIARRVGADGFLRLAVQIAPVGQQFGRIDDPAGIRKGNRGTFVVEQFDGVRTYPWQQFQVQLTSRQSQSI